MQRHKRHRVPTNSGKLRKMRVFPVSEKTGKFRTLSESEGKLDQKIK